MKEKETYTINCNNCGRDYEAGTRNGSVCPYCKNINIELNLEEENEVN